MTRLLQPGSGSSNLSKSAPRPLHHRSPSHYSVSSRAPAPEPFDDKTVAEMNPPGWLNTLIQSAPGGKFEHKFIWTTDAKLGSMFHFFPPLRPTLSNQSMTHVSRINSSAGLAHGAVLRLFRPGEIRTYMVVPQFPKRVDAKNAVCLAALRCGCRRLRARHQRGTRDEDACI
jgi:hypothetical protein